MGMRGGKGGGRRGGRREGGKERVRGEGGTGREGGREGEVEMSRGWEGRGERKRGGRGWVLYSVVYIQTTLCRYMTMYNTTYLVVDSAHRNHVHTLQQFDTLVDMLKQLWKCLQ